MSETGKGLKEIEERLDSIEKRLDRLDPPPRFKSIEEYVEWRNSHGGGMAAAIMRRVRARK